MKNILIVAGETSGDIHASNLINNLKKLNSNLSFFGIGGPCMENEGVKLLYGMENLSIIGVSEIFSKLKDVRSAFKKITDEVKKGDTSCAILVDYPGFNLAFSKVLKKNKIPVIYYITPQVWAWGKFRMRSIKKYIDKAIVIFNFEEKLFQDYGIDATFAGHPLLDRKTDENNLEKASLGLDENKLTIALLPGSRGQEVKRLLPFMLKTASLISQKKDVQFILLKSSSVSEKIYDETSKESKIPIKVVKDNTYGCLRISDFVLTSSGTATLEAAIMEKPMVITYKTSFITALFFKVFARTKFIGLANIIAKEEISPEILQYDAKPKRVADLILSIISSKEKMEKQIQALRRVKTSLGTPGASLRAARIVESFITKL